MSPTKLVTASYADLFEVVRETEGDTIKIANNSTTPTSRLVGIDAAKAHQKKVIPFS
jgi:endonuclease YncB( thermonuclease family)